MAAGGLAADGQPGSSERGSALEQRKILILYGSETGNSQEAAEDLERLALRLHFETYLSELNDVKPVTLTQYPLVIIVLSTTGQGDLPKNALVFWKQLLNRHLPPTCLRHVNFTTFGLGDSSYLKFNWAARKLHKRLEQLGATEFFPRGEADERHDEGIDGAYLPWSLSLRTHLLSEYPPPEGLEPIPLGVCLPPKILLELAGMVQLGMVDEPRPGTAEEPQLNKADRPPQPDIADCQSRPGMADEQFHLKAAQFSHVDQEASQRKEQELMEERDEPTNSSKFARLSESTTSAISGGIDILDRPNMLKDAPSKYFLEDSPSEAKPPTPTLLPIPDAVHVVVEQNQRVTPESHWQDVRLLTLNVTGNEPDVLLNTEVGDAVMIYPKNFPADVQALIDHMGWNEVADKPFIHYSRRKDGIAIEHVPRHCYAFPRSTLRDLLLYNYDITAIPKRSFFDHIQAFTEDATHKTRLAEFANPAFTDEFWDYTSRPRRSILEVLFDFPSVRVPYQWTPSIFPIIRGRQYSIASGGPQVREVDGSITRIDLLVALVKYKTILRKTRQGLASRYIETLAPGTPMHISIVTHQHPPIDSLHLLRLPQPIRAPSLGVPVLAIATGTGIAPVRSYFSERHYLDPTSRNILFYGGRNKKADFYFADEWSVMNVEVYTAFSRDQKQKIYVQDVIRREYQRICDLFNHGVILCLCGSAGKMPTAVRGALRDALICGGLAETEAAAQSFLERTYIWEEVW